MAHFDPQDTSATVHTDQRLPERAEPIQRADSAPRDPHTIQAHPNVSSDAPEADETTRAILRPE